MFEYTYDATGNRLTQTVTIDETPVTTTYTYDDANRLSQVGAQAYTWDNNGNLLNDGQRQYYYDPANRLTALVEGEDTTYYLYNGQGDRIAQIEDDVQTSYILDLNAGLTQVLNDGTSAYVYGLDLVSQQTGIYEEYPLRDALGSVRQVTDQSSAITGSRNYEPYGSLLSYSGEESMAYGFAGEWTDVSGIQYLRARMYSPETGRFLTKDSWEGSVNLPASYNKWLYTYANPVNLTDPSGLDVGCNVDDPRDPRCHILPQVVVQATTCPLIPTTEPKNWEDLGTWAISHYVTALENDPYFKTHGQYTNWADPTGYIPGLSQNKKYNLNWVYADRGVLFQGQGLSNNLEYISKDYNATIDERVPIFWYGKGGKYGPPREWETVAAKDPRLKPHDWVKIDAYPDKGPFEVLDIGEQVGSAHLDVFIGDKTISEADSLGFINSKVSVLKK